MDKTKKEWLGLAGLLIGILLVSLFLALFFSDSEMEELGLHPIPHKIPFPPPPPIPYEELEIGGAGPGNEMNAAVVLARFSTDDFAEGEQRAGATGELLTELDSDDVDTKTVAGLLDTIAPGSSIERRLEATEKLAALSEIRNLDPQQQTEVINEITLLITGNALNAEQRIVAADELARRFNEGELDTASALNLVDTIAPETGIMTRAEALHALTNDFDDGYWNDEKKMQFANEVHRLATGDDLNIEERIDATIDISGEALKAINRMEGSGESSLDDDDIDRAVNMTKDLLKGDFESMTNRVLETAPRTNESRQRSDPQKYLVCYFPPNYAGSFASFEKCFRRSMEGKFVRPFIHMINELEPYTMRYSECMPPWVRVGRFNSYYDWGRVPDECRSARDSASDNAKHALNYAHHYIEQREQGKSHIYAHHYAYQEVNFGYSREHNIIYAEQREQGVSHKRAREYAWLRFDKSHEYAVAYNHYYFDIGYDWGRAWETLSDTGFYAQAYNAHVYRDHSYRDNSHRGTSPNDVFAQIYAEQIVSGKSPRYIYYYIIGSYDGYRNYISLLDDYNHTEQAYAEQRELGKSHGYAYYYAYAIDEAFQEARHLDEDAIERLPEYAIAYAEQRAHGRSQEYARSYAEQVAKGKSHEEAYTHAEKKRKPNAYYDTLTEQIAEGKSHEYANDYASAYYRALTLTLTGQFAEGKSHEYATTYASAYTNERKRGGSPKIAAGYATTYTEERKRGRSPEIAAAYAEFDMIVIGIYADRATVYAYTTAYAEQVAQGESHEYATAYADKYATVYVRLGQTSFSLEEATDGAAAYAYEHTEAYTEQRKLGKSHIFADVYAKQRIEGESHEYADTYADAYVEKIELGMAPYCALFYADAYAEQRMDGESHDYASAYAAAVDVPSYRDAIELSGYEQLERENDLERDNDSLPFDFYRVIPIANTGKEPSLDEFYYEPPECDAIYAEQTALGKRGKSREYVLHYLWMRKEGKSHEYADPYAEQRSQGKSHLEAHDAAFEAFRQQVNR